jgi:spermidine synthase
VTRPWQTLDRVDTPEGLLELRQRGERDFVITVAGRVLMNSALHLTEDAAAGIACKEIADRPHPQVLIGGLGMGFTLRAALDALPRRARVTVAEITPAVVRWCRGPLAHLTNDALADRRVTIRIEDVAATLAHAARSGGEDRFDAIILDLYEGPRGGSQAKQDPLWGDEALRTTRDALQPGGVLTVWSEDPDPSFPRRLRLAGFEVEKRRPGKGGPRHAVYVAHPTRSGSRRRPPTNSL